MSVGNHYSEQAAVKQRPVCPLCGNVAAETLTKFGFRSACCGLWSWDRSPLVSAETHAARKTAHKAFDSLWRGGGMSRSAAYRALAAHMGIKTKDCHIKIMGIAEARNVPKAVEAIRSQNATAFRGETK